METTRRACEITTGDIVKLTGRTIVPADLLIIFTSNYLDNNQCYVETSNIDGETNLKLKEAPIELKLLTDTAQPKPSLFQGFLEYEAPNKNIHVFIGNILRISNRSRSIYIYFCNITTSTATAAPSGALHMENIPGPIPLSTSNLLLRSSVFTSTEWGYGIAVYTGQDTKVQLNTIARYLSPEKPPHTKRTCKI